MRDAEAAVNRSALPPVRPDDYTRGVVTTRLRRGLPALAPCPSAPPPSPRLPPTRPWRQWSYPWRPWATRSPERPARQRRAAAFGRARGSGRPTAGRTTTSSSTRNAAVPGTNFAACAAAPAPVPPGCSGLILPTERRVAGVVVGHRVRVTPDGVVEAGAVPADPPWLLAGGAVDAGVSPHVRRSSSAGTRGSADHDITQA